MKDGVLTLRTVIRITMVFRWIWQLFINLVWGDQIGPVLQALTDCGVASNVISEMNENDLRKLYKGGYRTAPLLKAANESGLVRSGIDPAKISFLLKAISGGGSSFLGRCILLWVQIMPHAPCILFNVPHIPPCRACRLVSNT
jgi:hypothetical protein